jgi:hypothetical protein
MAAREQVGLERLAHPARAHVEHLATSVTRARAVADAERRRRSVLEKELLEVARRRDALRRSERDRVAAAQAAEAAVAVGGVASGALAEKLRRRWFERS